MPETFEGAVTVLHTASGEPNAVIDGDKGEVVLGGGSGHDGDLVLLDSFGTRRIVLDAQAGRIHVFDNSGNVILDMGPNGDMDLGGGGHDGDIALKDGSGETRISLDGGNNRIRLRDSDGNVLCELGPEGDLQLGGAGGQDGDLRILDGAGQKRIHLNGQLGRLSFQDSGGNLICAMGPNGTLELGGNGTDGDIVLLDDDRKTRISLDAAGQNLRFFDAAGNQQAVLGPNGNMTLGGGDADGDIILRDDAGKTRISLDAAGQTIRFLDAAGNQHAELGPNGNLTLGGEHADGDVILKDGSGHPRIALDARSHSLELFDARGNQLMVLGPSGNIVAGGAGNNDGGLVLRDTRSVTRISLDAGNHLLAFRDDAGQEVGRIGGSANIRLGSAGRDGDILLFPASAPNLDDAAGATIHLDADAGDIVLRNADCAEEFEIDETAEATPGTVMAFAPDGRLRPSQRPHETAVVGVVSGAGEYRPGLILDRQAGRTARQPIAMMGKTFVRVTDEAGAIAVGDLLTSSSSPGVAMKAVDPARAFGAVIGKAMAPHGVGEGLIPMVIALQ